MPEPAGYATAHLPRSIAAVSLSGTLPEKSPRRDHRLQRRGDVRERPAHLRRPGRLRRAAGRLGVTPPTLYGLLEAPGLAHKGMGADPAAATAIAITEP